MLDFNTLYNKAGLVPTILILGGVSYAGILILVLLYNLVQYLRGFLRS
ncbi:hypothetical protein [Ammoniphilus resinae]|uniref:Uncharacterized protein n=1 Tax=Ammoniphilus resinae TaxID=861532 RepID=A0ABS4GWU7_9BACL|nr:hypothetical protein [Ammoniphilus resinae]MBP1934742.1 hypothetical protein [Ammoniphilus resinae]